MSWAPSAIESPKLRPAASDGHFNLHLAAHEWSLAEPIIIGSAEDILSRATWKGKVEPFQHQVQNLITFCRRLPVTLLADDVGLGKTISAGLILSELMARQRVKRALVICPKILMPQWVEELDQKFGIEAREAAGAYLDDEIRRKTPVVVTTYQAARDRIGKISETAFDMLILDEAHKIRNLHGTDTPPKMATEIRRTLEKRTFKFVLMLTATPIQNRLWDLYSLVDCLTVANGHKNPFGDPEEFSQRFIADPARGSRQLKQGREQEFRNILSQYIARTRRGDAKLNFPDRKVLMWPTTISPEERALQALLGEYILTLSPLVQSSLSQALFSSPAAFVAQVTNMAANGTLPNDFATRAQQLMGHIQRPAKLNAVMQVIEQMRQRRPEDWRVLIFTTRLETQRTIGEFLAQNRIPHGYISGGAAVQNQRSIARFKANPPEVNVIVSTDAGSEGVNLQVANVMINYDLPWNPMIVEQRIGRIQRLGALFRYVNVANVVARDSIEEKIVGRLMEKLQLAAKAIGDIEAILEAVGDDGEEESIESKIREMVVNALVGQDMEEAARHAQESITRAKEIIEDQRQMIDERLGKLDAIHHTGPAMPQLNRIQPRIPLEEFVFGALRADGFEITPKDNHLCTSRQRGKPPEYFTFNDAAADDGTRGHFGGNAPKLFKQGKPAFERLAQSWCEKHAHYVIDRRKPSQPELEAVAKSWAQSIAGCRIKSIEHISSVTSFQGAITCKAKAVVAHDSYEKLIPSRVHPKQHAQVESAGQSASYLGDEVELPSIAPGSSAEVLAAVGNDPDVLKFCQFYEQRRAEETAKAGDNPRLRAKTESDFSPRVFAESVAVRGIAYAVSNIRVKYEIDNTGDYIETLEIIAAASQILNPPQLEKCQATGAIRPCSSMGTCTFTNTRVAAHLLVTSSVSGRTALPAHSVLCEESGQLLLKDEADRSAVSQKLVNKKLLLPSPVSRRLGLNSEFRECEFTHSRVLVDECEISEISGKQYRSDEKCMGTLCGKAGHRSEFVRCAESGALILPTEAGKSDFSGQTVRQDLLVCSEKNAARRALLAETVVCSVSGKRLLRDEAGMSVVTKRMVDKDLLLASDKSGLLALAEEFVRCDETGARLLPDETSICAVSGKRVGKHLMSQSQLSGKWALSGLMAQCQKTGKRALPSELRACDVTGRMVAPDVLRQCAASGKIACIDQVVQSVVSGKFYLPEFATRSAESGSICGTSEAVMCTWNGFALLPSETGICAFTKLPFSKSLLNDQREFTVMRDLLDGRLSGSDDPAILQSIRPLNLNFISAAKEAQCRVSPNGQCVAICATQSAWFGFKRREIGFIVTRKDSTKAVGSYVIGNVDLVKGHWVPLS
ncbi:MAG TPA: SNF2-related protein [Planctomycetota bacterium]|nr:SNF2-related protein [Planctomycetota bacterium]